MTGLIHTARHRDEMDLPIKTKKPVRKYLSSPHGVQESLR